MGHLRKSATLGVILLLACGLAGVALADPAGPVEGVSVVLEKDLVAKTVLLDGQIVLHVTAETRITDSEGNPITLAALPTAPKNDGFVEMTPDSTVRYQASVEGGKLVAVSIAVEGKLIE